MAGFDNYGSNVRVRYEGNPMDNAYDVFVDQKVNDEWEVYMRYNSMSNDYAYTDARKAATALQSKLLRVTK
jgi:hypothetical protein